MNMSIRCSVVNCKFNEESEHYCTLNQIEVTQHQNSIEETDCDTNCKSYEPKGCESVGV